MRLSGLQWVSCTGASSTVDVDYLDLANHMDQASQLHEHGDPYHSSGNVHTVLGSWLWRCSSHQYIAPGHCFDERVWCAGKALLSVGTREYA